MAASPSSRHLSHPPEEATDMVEARWVRWIGPGVIALVAVGLITSAGLGAGDRPWVPPACGGPPGDRIEAARGGDVAMATLPREPWYRLDPRLDEGGALAGQQLRVGLGGGRTQRLLALPAESFVAGPFGRVVLVGTDDGTASRLQAVDVANGCAWAVAEERDVIRRATIDAAGTRIYEARVDRSTRADLGIWTRTVDGREAPRRLLAALPPDDRFGGRSRRSSPGTSPGADSRSRPAARSHAGPGSSRQRMGP